MNGETREIGIRPKQKDAAVPCMIACREHRFGNIERWLFDEFGDAVNSPGNFLAKTNPSISGFWGSRIDSERDEPPVFDQRQRRVDCGVKGRDIRNHMIGWHHQKRGSPAARSNRRKRDGRRSVAADGLQNQSLRRRIDSIKLCFNHIGVTLIGDDNRRSETRALRAPRRQLQHGRIVGQRKHLFGHARRRHRPKSRSRSAGEYDGHDRYGLRHIGSS